MDVAKEPVRPLPGAGLGKPPFRVKIAYGFGQAIESGYITISGFIFFYYTAVLGLSGSLVGLAMAISLAVDAILDPLIGSLSDNVRSRFGRRLPLMVVGAPLTAFALGLLFAPPPALAPLLLCGWLTLSKLVLRAFTSVFNLPYFALGAEMSDDYVERSRIVAYRALFGLVASVLITWLAYSLFFAGPGGLQRRESYLAFGWTIGALCWIGGAICCLGIWRYAVRLPQPTTPPHPLLGQMPPQISEVFRNRSFRTLFVSALLMFAGGGVNAALTSHAYIFVWKIPPEMIQVITYAYLAGTLAGIALTPALLGRMEKKLALVLGIGLVVASWTVLQSLRAAGLFLFEGAEAVPWLTVNSVLTGIGAGAVQIAYTAMMADAADEHEVLFDARREGLYFAGLGFASKAATGLGQLISGLALDLLRFPKAAGQQVNAELPDALLAHLVLAWGPGAAALAAASLLRLWSYAITRRRHQEISARLRAKRARDFSEGRST